MYGERSRAQMREGSRDKPRFSIFYCGCKQPKSIHMLFAAAKVQQKEEREKRKEKIICLTWENGKGSLQRHISLPYRLVIRIFSLPLQPKQRNI